MAHAANSKVGLAVNLADVMSVPFFA